MQGLLSIAQTNACIDSQEGNKEDERIYRRYGKYQILCGVELPRYFTHKDDILRKVKLGSRSGRLVVDVNIGKRYPLMKLSLMDMKRKVGCDLYPLDEKYSGSTSVRIVADDVPQLIAGIDIVNLMNEELKERFRPKHTSS